MTLSTIWTNYQHISWSLSLKFCRNYSWSSVTFANPYCIEMNDSAHGKQLTEKWLLLSSNDFFGNTLAQICSTCNFSREWWQRHYNKRRFWVVASWTIWFRIKLAIDNVAVIHESATIFLSLPSLIKTLKTA